MRVTLVQCPPWGSLPPLGIASLKPYLEQRGHPTTCVDLNIAYCRERHLELAADEAGVVYARPDPFASDAFDQWRYEFVDGEVRFLSDLQQRPLPMDRWADSVLASAPEVVGFSVQATNLGVTLQLAQHLRRREPGLRLVLGGPNVAEANDGRRALLTGIPDAVVEGEGEETLVALVEAFESGDGLGAVAGIGHLVAGVPTWTERRPLIRDIDVLPFPDFSDFDWELYPHRYEIPIMGSRGCVLQCAFCYETVYWKRFRTQSPERIVAEIEHQIATHPLRDRVENGAGRTFVFSFADSLVNGHPAGLRRTAQLIIDRGIEITWGGQATINTKMDDDYFRLLRASGCNGLSFGLESGSQDVLDSMGKRFRIDEAEDFIRRVHETGIKVIVNIMVGFPNETAEDFRNTLHFLRRIRDSIYMVNNVSPAAIPTGSRLHQDPGRWGVVPVDLKAWPSGLRLDWVTPETGTQDDRQARAEELHRWMRRWDIPHQQLAPGRDRTRRRLRRRKPRATPTGPPAWHTDPLDSPVVPPPDPPPDGPPCLPSDEVEDRIRRQARARGLDPLVLEGAGQVVERVRSEPGWAASLHPEALVGRSFDELAARLAPRLGRTIDPVAHHHGDGVIEVDVAIAEPFSDSMGALHLFAYPPAGPDGPQVLAIFPVPMANHASPASLG